MSFADVKCQINSLINDLISDLIDDLINDLIGNLIDDLIGDLIGGLIEADSAVCKVLVKAEFCRCNLSVDSESSKSFKLY